jgi:tRNA nucleotidyltransferase (CCA-adding enzyme)
VTALRLDVVIRVAGGWVRDKLLARDSYDIDFALSSMTGEGTH